MAAKYNDEGSPSPDSPTCFNEDEVNRKLFNEQKSSNNIEVYLRIRRLLSSEEHAIKKGYQIAIDGRSLSLSHAPRPGTSAQSQKFSFSSIFPPTSGQEEVYKEAMEPMVMRLINGGDILFFAYGASGSGKTFSIHGTPQDPGMVPQAMRQLFELLGDRRIPGAKFKPSRFRDILNLTPAEEKAELDLREKLLNYPLASLDTTAGLSSTTASETSSQFSQDSLNVRSMEESVVMLSNPQARVPPAIRPINDFEGMFHSVWISFAEFYNEAIYDLLDVDSRLEKKNRARMQLVQDDESRIYIKGITEVCIHNAEEAIRLLALGRQSLHVASTNINQRSSRSHCIMSVRLVRVEELDNPACGHTCQMSVCDLAGSEKMKKANGDDTRVKEAGNIHISLLVLGRCLNALRHNQLNVGEKKPIPFRESKLTRLFQTFLLGGGKIAMLSAISPAASMVDEALHTLKFSALTQQVVTLPPAVQGGTDDAWLQTSRHWKSFAPSPDTEEELEDKDVIIEEMAQIIKGMEEEIFKYKPEREKLEFEIRKEVAREWADIISKMRVDHRVRVKSLQAKIKEYREKSRRMREEMEQEEESDEDDEEEEIDKSEMIQNLKEELALVQKQLQEMTTVRDQLHEEKIQREFEWTARDKANSYETDSLKCELAKLQKELSLKKTTVHQEETALQAQLAELHRQLSLKEKEIKDLNSTIEKSGEIFQENAAEIERLQVELAKQKATATNQKELVRVQNQLQEAQVRLREKSQRELEWTDKEATFSTEIASMEKQIAQLCKELSLKDKEIKDLNFTIEKSGEIFLENTTELDDLKEKLAKQVQLNTTQKLALEKLQAEKSQRELEWSSKESAFSEQLEFKNSQLAKLHKELSLVATTNVQEVASLQTQLEELRTDLTLKETTNSQEVASLQTQLAELCKKLSIKETTNCQEVAALQAQLASLHKELSLKENEIKDQKSTIEKAGEIFLENSTELDRLKEELAEQAEAARKQEMATKELAFKLEEAERRPAATSSVTQTSPQTNKIEMLQKALDAKEEALKERKDLEKDMDKLATSLADKEAEILSLQKNLQARGITISELNENLSQKTSEAKESDDLLSELRAQKEELSANLIQQTKELEKYSKENSQLRAELEQIKLTCKELANENLQLKKTITDLQVLEENKNAEIKQLTLKFSKLGKPSSFLSEEPYARNGSSTDLGGGQHQKTMMEFLAPGDGAVAVLEKDELTQEDQLKEAPTITASQKLLKAPRPSEDAQEIDISQSSLPPPKTSKYCSSNKENAVSQRNVAQRRGKSTETSVLGKKSKVTKESNSRRATRSTRSRQMAVEECHLTDEEPEEELVAVLKESTNKRTTRSTRPRQQHKVESNDSIHMVSDDEEPEEEWIPHKQVATRGRKRAGAAKKKTAEPKEDLVENVLEEASRLATRNVRRKRLLPTGQRPSFSPPNIIQEESESPLSMMKRQIRRKKK